MFFGVLVFSFLIFYLLILITIFFICFISYIYFSIFHKLSRGIVLSKTIFLFDEILHKIFKINMTICNVLICIGARIIHMLLKKHACIFTRTN
jgi:hypothetical protein